MQYNRSTVSARALVGAIVLALVAFAPTPQAAAAQDIVGTWELTTMGGQAGQLTSTLTLAMEDDALKGKIKTEMPSMARGGGARARGGSVRAGGGRSRTTTISEIHVDGDSFSFVVTTSFGQRSITLTYSGTVDGDTMSGIIEGMGDGASRSFTGKRTET